MTDTKPTVQECAGRITWRGGYEKKERRAGGKCMKKSIKVTYDGELSGRLDDKIIKAMSGIGYELWASGYDMTTNIRDLAFDTQEAK